MSNIIEVFSKKLGYKKILVDPEDLAILSKHKWSLIRPKNIIYAVRRSKINEELPYRTLIFMHRFIMHPDSNSIIDHKNGNGLDNRKLNLRVCSYSENLANVGKSIKKSSSIFKGVSFCSRRKNWMAQIMHHGKSVFVGRYKTESEAAINWNKKAKEINGEFAFQNAVYI